MLFTNYEITNYLLWLILTLFSVRPINDLLDGLQSIATKQKQIRNTSFLE